MQRYDVAIIGTGPAGVSAALTAKNRNLSILLTGSRQMSEAHILPRENDGFKYLKGSKTETDTIRAMLNSTSLCCLQGKDATEAQLKSLMASQTHIHISTHGFCSDMERCRTGEGWCKHHLYRYSRRRGCGCI